MESNITLKIKKRNQPEFLIWLIVIFPFAFSTMFDLLSLPSFFKYVLDAAWVLLIVLMFKNSKLFTFSKINIILSIFVITFLIVTLVLYFFSYQSILYYLWGVRNNFRFYAFFFACIAFLKKDDIGDYFSLFDTLFWVNSLVCTVQFFAFDLRGDFLGGIFGTEKGCNAYTNILFSIVAIKSIVYYLNKRESIWTCIAKSATMMIVSAWAEIKFFYVEFLIIIVMAILLTSFSWRKLAVVFVSAGAILIGMYVFSLVFPNILNYMSLQSLFETATSDKGYTGSGDLNRLTTIPVITKSFLTTTSEKLFGLGLGNCDTAAYSFLQTPFFTEYSYLNYNWFSTAFIFLETGFTGLIFFFGFFILVFFLGRKAARTQGAEKMYCHISSILAICCILIAIYNSSLRTEAGYMAYFVLALPFVGGARREDVASGNTESSLRESLHEELDTEEDPIKVD